MSANIRLAFFSLSLPSYIDYIKYLMAFKGKEEDLAYDEVGKVCQRFHSTHHSTGPSE